jgi:hypothetical protein
MTVWDKGAEGATGKSSKESELQLGAAPPKDRAGGRETTGAVSADREEGSRPSLG